MKFVYILPSVFDPISWNNWEPLSNPIWKRTFNLNEAEIVIGIDSLDFNCESKHKKILLLSEPIGILPQLYNIFNDDTLLNNIDLIGTHHLRFLENIF